MIKAEMDRIAVLEQQLGIFVDEHPSHPGHKSSPHVKGVIVDGVISCDDNMVKKAIKDFKRAAYKRQVGSFHKPKLKLPTLPPRKGVANSSFGGMFYG